MPEDGAFCYFQNQNVPGCPHCGFDGLADTFLHMASGDAGYVCPECGTCVGWTQDRAVRTRQKGYDRNS